MRTETKAVYYCDHCGRHRLTPSTIIKHEPKCIYNPGREKCGWHDWPCVTPVELTEELKRGIDLDWLRETVGGCPACMLSVVVQAGLTYHEQIDLNFNYKAEIELFREAEREEHLDVW